MGRGRRSPPGVLPRRRVGRSFARRSPPVRTPYSGGSPGWALVGDDLAQTRGSRSAFQQFDPARVARFNARKIERLLRDPTNVRNRLKIESAVNNARRMLEVQGGFGSFDAYIWQFVEGVPIAGRRRILGDLPSETREPKAMSKDRFRFSGP